MSHEIAGDVATVETTLKAIWETEIVRFVQLTISATVKNAVNLSNAQENSLVHRQLIRSGNEVHGGNLSFDSLHDHDAQGSVAWAMEIGERWMRKFLFATALAIRPGTTISMRA